MFTGLIQQKGKILRIQKTTRSIKITILPEFIPEDLSVGCSIAVNGICLTVTHIIEKALNFDAMPLTFQHTTMLDWKPNKLVNLEQALLLTQRIEGHFVTGHVDGTGHIISIQRDDIAYRIRINCESNILAQILQKGSVALDGVSLTVATKESRFFEVGIIPHTFKNTTLFNLKTGDKINIETDILGKYILQKTKTSSYLEQVFAL